MTFYLIIYFYILLKFYFDPYSIFFFTSIIFEGGGTTIQTLLRAPILPAAALNVDYCMLTNLPTLQNCLISQELTAVSELKLSSQNISNKRNSIFPYLG